MKVQGNSFVSQQDELGQFTRSQPGAPLSEELCDYLGVEPEEEGAARAMLMFKLADYVKPCHDLGYCPYGSVVEMMPFPPSTIAEREQHLAYLKKCLETGGIGPEHEEPLDDELRGLFEEMIADGTEDCVEEVSRFETRAQCDVFGHLCPVYFLAEEICDTQFEEDYADDDWDECETCDDRDECEAYREHMVMLEAEQVLEAGAGE